MTDALSEQQDGVHEPGLSREGAQVDQEEVPPVPFEGIEGAEPVVQVPYLRSLAFDFDGDEGQTSVETTEKAEATQMSTLVAARKMTDEKIRIAQLMRSRGEAYEKIAEVLNLAPSTIRRNLDPRAAKNSAEYNFSRRKAPQVPATDRKVGHQFPWEGVE